MTRFCAAYGCTNRSSKPECKAKGITFHSFPLKDPPRLKQWLFRMRRLGFFPSEHSALCSNHFTENSFVYQPFTNRRLLAQNAVPSVFTFSAPKSNKKQLCCKPRSSAKNSSKEISGRHGSIDSRSVQPERKRPIIVKL